MSYAGEIVPLSEMFFKDMPELGAEEQEVINGAQVPELMQHLYGKLEALEPFEAAEIKNNQRSSKETGIKVNNYLCQYVLLLLDKCMVLNCQIQLKC